MSLLLDALKKTGSAQQTESSGSSSSGNKSEMSLEELPDKAVLSATPAPASLAPNPSPRSTGENLFAAKKAPARKKFHYNLGIVPTAIIIGLVLGTAGGIYVWIEIQPPKAAPLRTSSAEVASYSAPAPRPAPPLALPPEIQPKEMAAPAKVSRPAPATNYRILANNEKRAPDTQSTQGIQIQKKLETDSAYSTLMAAYQAYQNGDYGTAWQRYREVLLNDVRNRDALLGMAAIAQQQQQDDVAMQYYRQVLALDPRDPVAQAGISAFATEDSTAKESRLKISLAQSPQSAALHYALGNLYTEQSRWGDAQQAYFNAFKIEPSNAQFTFHLATTLDHLGQVKIAAQYYRQALQLDAKGNAGFDHAQTEQRLNQLLAIGTNSAER